MKKYFLATIAVILCLALAYPLTAGYRKVVVIKNVFKLPADCKIQIKNKNEKNLKKGDMIYFENGDIQIVDPEDVNIPSPNKCPVPGCTEHTVKRRICPVHGDVTDIGE